MKKYLEVKSNKDEIFIIASDESVDRDGDIMRVAGINIDNYKKNPVLLEIHRWDKPPIGTAETITKTENQLIIKPKFANTERGKEWKSLVQDGIVRTVSIGFRTKKSFYKDEFGEIKNIDPVWYEKHKDDLVKANRVVWESELFEVSFVPVPANPNAQIVMAQKGFETAYAFKTAKMTEEDDEQILIEFEIDEVKNAVPWNAHPKQMEVFEEGDWDGNKARMNLRKWASSDGSGDKDKINFKRFRAGFGWYDANAPENLTSYKLPHHDVKDGKFGVHRKGTIAAMAALLGARGGIKIPAEDKKGAYNHLAGHYKKHFDMEPPEYKEYTLEEAIKTFDDELLEEWLKIHIDVKGIKELIQKYESEIEIKNEKINQLSELVEQEKSTNPSTDEGEELGFVEIEGIDSLDELKELLKQKTFGGNE